MATRPASPNPPVAPRFKPSMRRSRSRVPTAGQGQPNRSSRPQDCASRPSADLAGRSVALSIDVPAAFDVPLAPHHKLIGRWVAGQEDGERRYSRPEARRHIEHVFNAAVLEILKPFDLAELRVVALCGDEQLPPALVMICDSIGEIDLGWIAKSNVLSDTMLGHVAPVSWRATAYKALVETLNAALPVFAYDDLFEEIALYYWDGETEDEGARKALIMYHGAEPDDLDEMTMPSQMHARRPDWMLAESAAPYKRLPEGLCQRLRRLRKAHDAVKAFGPLGSAWHFDWDAIREYLPEYEDRGTLPGLTLVPFDHFARELDDVARHGMEYGFMDVAGLCQLTDAAKVDDWFASLKLGVELLLAAQDLINFDPANPGGRS